MHPNTNRECISAYCRLHQCSPAPLRIRETFTTDQVMQWFASGRDLPRGRAGRSQHLQMWRDAVRAAA
eukprot:15453950-Alexandrium_andersonii.AAC.1